MSGRFAGFLAAILLAPLLSAVVTRVKSRISGRTGPPLTQGYRDLARLLGKATVYSTTTTAVVRLGPVVGLAAVAAALLVVPLGGSGGVLSFSGDFLVLAMLLGVGRFALVLGALDTGSAFEGMGAARELLVGALAEPVMLLSVAVLANITGQGSLTAILGRVDGDLWSRSAPGLLLLAMSLGIILLAENARIPVDDPTTHLELTMIHEAMVLDHGGPDLAFIDYASALKLWLFGALVVGILLPGAALPAGWGMPAAIAALLLLAAVVGLIESVMARVRLTRIPHLLLGAGVLAILGLVLVRP